MPPRGGPPARGDADRDEGLRGLVRPLGLSGLTAAAVALAGGGGAFWLCVPVALLLAAPAAGAADAALMAALPAVAALATELLASSLGPAPSIPLAILVVAGSVAVMRGSRGRVERERELLRASALSDPLTGVANRRALDERIDYEVARHARQQRPFALLMLDLDGFKAVNDRFGHSAGDDLLRDVAEALRGAVREQDTVGRIGGDEFCILAPETDRDGAERLLLRVRTAVGAVTAGLDVLSASVGVGLFPVDGEDGATVLAAADEAQSEAKRRLYRDGTRTRRAA
jgi:diguanylate cyclase (GGDEF)-like protein